MLMEGCLMLREVRRVGSHACRIIGGHFMEEGHLHCSLRTILQLKRTLRGNEELTQSLGTPGSVTPGEGVMASAGLYHIQNEWLSVKRMMCGVVPAVS